MGPECFRVQELVGREDYPIAVPLSRETNVRGYGDGPFTLFSLTKCGITTHRAVRIVADQLCVPFDAVSYHGLKDRHAFTSQAIAVEGFFCPSFSFVPRNGNNDEEGIWLDQKWNLARRLWRGGNVGNRFSIVVMTNARARSVGFDILWRVPNFFGAQRFGCWGGAEAGRMILEGNFDEAFAILLRDPNGRKLDAIRRSVGSAREALLDSRYTFEFSMTVLKWQSFLWNQLLRMHLECDVDLPDRIPMWSLEPDVCTLYQDLWNPASLDLDIVSSLQTFSRPTIVYPKNISYEQNLLGWRVEFDLPSGAYATVALSRIFSLGKEHVL